MLPVMMMAGLSLLQRRQSLLRATQISILQHLTDLIERFCERGIRI
jgi:hypothetical protein